jgi:hypothetical protein
MMGTSFSPLYLATGLVNPGGRTSLINTNAQSPRCHKGDLFLRSLVSMRIRIKRNAEKTISLTIKEKKRLLTSPKMLLRLAIMLVSSIHFFF